MLATDITLMNTKAETNNMQQTTLVAGERMNKARVKLKRVMDVALSLFVISLIWPVMLLVAVAVKLTSEGPILFKQKRQGLNGDVFYIYKFRSMKVHAEKSGQVTQAKKNDSRITSVGRFIRKTSIDELPQFFNVVKGDMSIVGPRPHALEHDKYYGERIQGYNDRYMKKPGITGLAQISGCRGETATIEEMKKRIDKDLEYIQSCSLSLDIKIMVKTPFTLLKGNNY